MVAVTRIEMLEPEWRLSEAQQLFEHVRAEIAKAFQIPEWALQDADARREFLRRAELSTATMRREAVRLLSEYRFPRAIVGSLI